MAARTRTVNELIADARFRSNLEGETARHPDANITRLINESYQRLRELVSEQSPYFLKAKSGTLTSGPLVPDAVSLPSLTAAFSVLPLPDDCLRVFGVDIEIEGQISELEALPFEARNSFQSGSTRQGVPVGYYPFNMDTATASAANLAIIPAAGQTYPYTLWYLPVWTDLSAGSAVNLFGGWEEWLLWDVCVKLAHRDNDRQAAYAIAMQERAREEALIKATIKPTRTNPLRVQNTRERRLSRNQRRDRW